MDSAESALWRYEPIFIIPFFSKAFPAQSNQFIDFYFWSNIIFVKTKSKEIQNFGFGENVDQNKLGY